jgi:hypothetical protein
METSGISSAVLSADTSAAASNNKTALNGTALKSGVSFAAELEKALAKSAGIAETPSYRQGVGMWDPSGWRLSGQVISTYGDQGEGQMVKVRDAAGRTINMPSRYFYDHVRTRPLDSPGQFRAYNYRTGETALWEFKLPDGHIFKVGSTGLENDPERAQQRVQKYMSSLPARPALDITEEQSLTYNPDNIPALEPETVDLVKKYLENGGSPAAIWEEFVNSFPLVDSNS